MAVLFILVLLHGMCVGSGGLMVVAVAVLVVLVLLHGNISYGLVGEGYDVFVICLFVSGILYLCAVIGPGFGYLVGGYFLDYYVDFDVAGTE